MTRAKHLYHLFVTENHAIIEAEPRKLRVIETVLGQISEVQVPPLYGRWRKSRSPNYKTREYNHRQMRRVTGSLVIESPVRVFPKQRLSYGWERINLQQSQAFLESVVDFDLALATHDNHAARTEF